MTNGQITALMIKLDSAERRLTYWQRRCAEACENLALSQATVDECPSELERAIERSQEAIARRVLVDIQRNF
jgi:hypothetical protein